jgi:hypothetical protein
MNPIIAELEKELEAAQRAIDAQQRYHDANANRPTDPFDLDRLYFRIDNAKTLFRKLDTLLAHAKGLEKGVRHLNDKNVHLKKETKAQNDAIHAWKEKHQQEKSFGEFALRKLYALSPRDVPFSYYALAVRNSQNTLGQNLPKGHHVFCNGNPHDPVKGCRWCDAEGKGFWHDPKYNHFT